MARPNKIGLDYFPFEVTYFNDLKVRKLIKYQGGKSIAVHTHLLCNIYSNGYYLKWDNELPFIISEDTGYEQGFINEVIKCCFDVELFHRPTFEKFRVLTSKGIQERFSKICKDAKRKFNISAELNLINSEETIKTTEVIPQSKEKDIKEEETKKDALPREGDWFDIFKNECLREENLAWREMFCMTLKVELTDIPKILDQFKAHCITGGAVVTNLKEYKTYLRNWMLNKNAIEAKSANTTFPGRATVMVHGPKKKIDLTVNINKEVQWKINGKYGRITGVENGVSYKIIFNDGHSVEAAPHEVQFIQPRKKSEPTPISDLIRPHK